MNIWDMLMYFSVAVCYFTAFAVIYGWIRYALGK